MLRPRLFPVLLMHKGGFVKTERFAAPKYLGDPINIVKIFNEKETDELAVFDIDATVEQREPNFKMIGYLALECRMPLCYGGGVKTREQAKRIISLGAEKVAISSAALETPALISQIAADIGSQSCVVVIDVRKHGEGYRVWTHNGRRETTVDALAFAREAERLGAGEIVVNSIDRDGTMAGYDLDLARRLRGHVQVQISMLGGAGKLAHIGELIETCGIVGAGAGSLFVFKGPHRAVLINYPQRERKLEVIDAAMAARAPLG